ncbi:MAG: hypothetical protein JST00_13715 [Deltaproteobacteria bacterium]|nr:hypothetical protein [Deltaproteobacteria bacterium]
MTKLRGCTALTFAAGVMLASMSSRAQSVERADLPSRVEEPKPDFDEPPPESGPPRARKGLQFGIRFGASFPSGRISPVEGDSMLGNFAWQGIGAFELGLKPIPELFVGAYVELGYGDAADLLEEVCSANLVACTARTSRVGFEILVHLLPAQWVDPWLGYGFGYDGGSLVYGEGRKAKVDSFDGLEVARLMSGVDFRLSRSIGVGAFLQLGVGRYTDATRRGRPFTGTLTVLNDDIPESALHSWTSLGLRVIAFP